MPRGDNLKDVDRAAAGRKGGHARADKIRDEKAHDAERIEQGYRERIDGFWTRLDQIVEGEDDAAALRAILAGFDRLAGRPSQKTEVTGRVNLVHYRERLTSLLADRAHRREP